ncbi:MAG: outer membrane lipoprotein-sorting protein [Candidatus Atribacteria bacterium]|nr:MAG: outer membrane lipoprotein-sorting protein [Candidatus Atribacteria bacterium]
MSADYVMERLVYYDQRETVVQTATFTDIVDIGTRRFATTIIILDEVYGDRTVERIEDLQFDLALDVMFFSLDTFEAWGDD